MRKLVILIIALMLMGPAVVSANMLVNPGFEGTGPQGHLTGWTNEWGVANLSASPYNPHSGYYAVRNENDGAMYQDVAITPGQSYRVTGWASIPIYVGENPPWGTFISLQYINASGGTVGDYQIDIQDLTRNQYNMADTGYQVAPGTAVAARVRFGTWTSDPSWEAVAPTDFDDFSLTAIPEPSSLVLLLTGLTGLFGLSFKKR